jgi:hypothetical protein
MMSKKFLSCIAAFTSLAFAVAAPALADTHNFTVDNQGGHQVDHIYVSPISDKNWGPDQLSSDEVLPPKTKKTWSIDTNCEMDVKVVYHDGHEAVDQDVDTCNKDLILYY